MVVADLRISFLVVKVDAFMNSCGETLLLPELTLYVSLSLVVLQMQRPCQNTDSKSLSLFQWRLGIHSAEHCTLTLIYFYSVAIEQPHY